MQEQGIPTARSVKSTTMPLPHLAFKNALLKPFSLEIRGASHLSPCMDLQQNHFLLQTPMVQLVWAHCQAHELTFCKNLKYENDTYSEMIFIILP